jgi:pentatricopeptide repeat protein
MLRQVFQGAQWYQHVACASHFFGNSKPPPLRRSFSVIASRLVDHGDPKDKIRFFEQDTLASKQKIEIDPKAEEHAEQEEMRSHLAALDRELEILRQGPYDPNSPFMKQLPEQDRIIAIEALRKYEAEQGQDDERIGLEEIFDEELDDMLREEFEGLAKEEEEDWDPTKPVAERELLPAKRRSEGKLLEDDSTHPYVDRFNECLTRVVDMPNTSTRQELWKWYRRCKQTVPNFLQSMTRESSQILWESQFRDGAAPSTRISHLQTLVDDMRIIGRTPSATEMIMYIEALYQGGQTGKALDVWEAQQADLKQGQGDVDAYWKLGVQLFAAHGDPQRAQDIAFAFLLNNKSRHARVLIPVIIAWARESANAAANKAWALYLQLKTLLISDMTMDDYDSISVGFLKAGRVNLALAVFKDMMITGKDPSDDSTALFKRSLGLAGNLQASSISEQDVNKVSLSALTILPRRLQNKFFYASWMKKLIGMGEVDSAASVVELMYERGIRPDAKHLNGIIGAWLRQGNATSRDRAERLGWAMIQHRIDLVWTREFSNASVDVPRKPSFSHASDSARLPKFMRRTLPQANIETFSILLLHYTRRGDDDMVKYLTKCLDDARIRPNSYFMNHLLYAELRRHDIHALWEKYETMRVYVQPDLETFACLWDCGKLQYDPSKRAFDASFPSARGLFSEMMQWYSKLTPRGKGDAQEEFSKDLYDQITRCFCLSKDISGTLIALYAMRDMFGIFPDDDTARMLVLQVARMAGVPPDTAGHRLRRLSTTPRIKENIGQVHELLELLNERKASMLEGQGLRIEQLDEEERKQYQLEIMADLLVAVIERTTSSPEQVRDQITAATRDMGADGIDSIPHPEGNHV